MRINFKHYNMKYITIDKHPDIKEGTIFRKSEGRTQMYVSETSCITYITESDLDESIEKGYIKEVEEKEFTKSDMIEFYIHVVRPSSLAISKDVFNEWKKQRQITL